MLSATFSNNTRPFYWALGPADTKGVDGYDTITQQIVALMPLSRLAFLSSNVFGQRRSTMWPLGDGCGKRYSLRLLAHNALRAQQRARHAEKSPGSARRSTRYHTMARECRSSCVTVQFHRGSSALFDANAMQSPSNRQDFTLSQCRCSNGSALEV